MVQSFERHLVLQIRGAFKLMLLVLIGSQPFNLIGIGRHQMSIKFKPRCRNERIIIATFHFGIMESNIR